MRNIADGDLKRLQNCYNWCNQMTNLLSYSDDNRVRAISKELEAVLDSIEHFSQSAAFIEPRIVDMSASDRKSAYPDREGR